MKPQHRSHLNMTEEEFSERVDRLAGWAEAIEAGGLRLYLALDGVWAEDLATWIRANFDIWTPLEGEPGLPNADAHPRAPILVDLSAHPPLAEHWIAHCYVSRIGVIFASALDLSSLRTSLKRFGLVVAGDAREAVTFRYFDAQVLECFLSSASEVQRADFFQNLGGAVIPHNDLRGWSIYRPDAHGLIVCHDTGAGQDWHSLPPADGDFPDQSIYESSFPFRVIPPNQLMQMELCAEAGFHREICRFLLMAFPESLAEVPTPDLYDHVQLATEHAKAAGAREESAQFLWCILSVMSGHDFPNHDPARTYLAEPGIDLESKLETLVFEAGATLDNQLLMDIADTTEVWSDTPDGTPFGYLHRSGRILER